jgi:hypothetical protein
MSLPRSVDRTDIGGSTVSVPGTTETVVIVGPNLQTPKDVSFIVAIISFAFTPGTAGNGLIAKVRQGSTVAGAQIGQAYSWGGLAAGVGLGGCLLVSAQVQFTDYVQWCLTLQQTSASGAGTVGACTFYAISF